MSYEISRCCYYETLILFPFRLAFSTFFVNFSAEDFFIAKIRPQIYYAANTSCCIFTQNNMIMLSKLAHGENCCITMIVSELKHM